MRLRIDSERCEGHGRCYSLAAEVFEPDELGEGTVIGDGIVPPSLEDAANLAVENCPEQAIEIVEA